MKNTILSRRDLVLLERLVIRGDKIVSFDQIRGLMDEPISESAARKWVVDLAKAGWLIRLKKGLYLVVSDISTLGFVDVSDLVIAQAFDSDSYVSFERALQHYGMFDQLLARIDSVTTRSPKRYKVLQIIYTFSKTQHDLYWGFGDVHIDHRLVKVADPEKAILDLLYFRTSYYAASLVLEKLRVHADQLDFAKLKRYSVKYSLGMVRKIGFLLDQIGVDTSDLLSQQPVKKNSYNQLTQDADQFNGKWRLYYPSALLREVPSS